jgi:hypothetical protein
MSHVFLDRPIVSKNGSEKSFSNIWSDLSKVGFWEAKFFFFMKAILGIKNFKKNVFIPY